MTRDSSGDSGIVFYDDAPSELQDLMIVFRNVCTIREVLKQTPSFPYIKNIAEANDVAMMAIESKLQLYFDTKTK